MDDFGTTTSTHTWQNLGHAVDRELVRIAQDGPADEADRAASELRARHRQLLDDAARDGQDAQRLDRVFVRAVRGFDPTSGATFADYLDCHLRSAARQAAGGVTAPLPTGMREGRFLQVRVARLELQDELGREPTVDELADRLGFSTAQVLDAMSVRSAERVRTRRLAAHLATEDRGAARLDVAISELDERTRRVLDRVLHEGRSRSEVARELGISTFDVHDLEQRGRAHLDRAA